MRDPIDPLARWGAEVRRRLGGSRVSGVAEASVVEELSLHLEDLYRELLARGVPDDEARRRALADLDHGDDLEHRLLRHVADPSSPVPPATRSRRWLTAVPGDARYALRLLLRERGFTSVAMITLALGVGPVTAMFSLVHGLLLRPLPYPEGERLVTLIGPGMILPTNLSQWREGAKSLEQFGGFNLSHGLLEEPGNTRRLRIMEATDDVLPLLAARPIRGRLWAPGEGARGDTRIALISQRLWVEVFRGVEPSSRMLTIDGVPHSILGVLPDDFHNLGYSSDAWVPFAGDPDTWLQGVARVRAGATLEQVRLELAAVADRVEALPIAAEFGRSVRVHRLRDMFTGDARATLVILFAASGCVLLLACANMANLLLSRAAGRGRDLAIRNALGAGRGALLRHLLVEHVMLAIVGGALGLALGWLVVRGLVPLLPPGFTRMPPESIGIDLVVLGVTLAVSMSTVLLAGLPPTLASMRSATPMAVMSRGTPARSARRWREALIAAETAIAAILLVSTTLLVRTYLTLRPSTPGYETGDRIVATLRLHDEPRRNVELVRRLLREIELTAPGTRAAVSNQVPLSGLVGLFRIVAIDGKPTDPDAAERPPMLDVNAVSPEYIDVLGIPMARGRALDDGDVLGTQPVVVVNRAAARRFWPDLENPVGRRLNVDLVAPGDADQRVELLIVGVYEDVRTSGLSTTARPQGLLPYSQTPWAGAHLIVHAPPGSGFDASTLRELVARIDPTVPVGEISTLAAIASRAVAAPRYQMSLMSGFGLLALLLAVIGCYGVVAYSVAQRRREFGVRMALGAAPAAILRAVMRRAALLVTAGLVVGGAAAVAATRVIESSFFGVVPGDPATFALVFVALLAVSLAAALVPARRAAAVDPVVALREE